MSEERQVSEVIQALLKVKKDVGAISKDRKGHGYNFRGIDDVISATHQAFLDHEVLVIPQKVVDYQYGTITTDKGKEMGHIRIVIEYIAVHSSGNSVVLVGAGEAFDSGDKSTPKASSVAMRTALLQALSIPTDIEDVEERNDARGEAPATEDLVADAVKRLLAAGEKAGIGPAPKVIAWWSSEYDEDVRQVKDVEKLTEQAVKWELQADA